jgi:hypothetical protein
MIDILVLNVSAIGGEGDCQVSSNFIKSKRIVISSSNL